MTGFLQRVAVRAMGVADQVRTGADLRYSVPPTAVDGRPAVAAEAAPMSVVDRAPAVGVAVEAVPALGIPSVPVGHRAPQPVVRDSPMAETLQPHRERTELQSHDQQPAVERRALATAGAIEAERAPGRSAPLSIGPAHAAPEPLVAGRAATDASSWLAPEREDRSGAEAAAGPRVEFESRAQPLSRPESGLSNAIGVGGLLLSARPRPEYAGQTPDRPRGNGERRTDTSSTGEAVTEVHVSIGRIEVTAVHEAPAARSVGPRRPAPMSLDDYLATRRRRQP